MKSHPPHETNARPDTFSAGKSGLETDVESIEGDCGSRLIYVCEPVTPVLTTRVTTELLQYEAQGPGQPIHMFIYSPGGCVISGLAIIDTMHHITAPVFTYAIGFAASMGAVILACGHADHRPCRGYPKAAAFFERRTRRPPQWHRARGHQRAQARPLPNGPAELQLREKEGVSVRISFKYTGPRIPPALP